MIIVPDRHIISEKIDNIVNNPDIGAHEYYGLMSEWLDTFKMEPVLIAGEFVDPKQQILDDLGSYANYSTS